MEQVMPLLPYGAGGSAALGSIYPQLPAATPGAADLPFLCRESLWMGKQLFFFLFWVMTQTGEATWTWKSIRQKNG